MLFPFFLRAVHKLHLPSSPRSIIQEEAASLWIVVSSHLLIAVVLVLFLSFFEFRFYFLVLLTDVETSVTDFFFNYSDFNNFSPCSPQNGFFSLPKCLHPFPPYRKRTIRHPGSRRSDAPGPFLLPLFEPVRAQRAPQPDFRQ